MEKESRQATNKWGRLLEWRRWKEETSKCSTSEAEETIADAIDKIVNSEEVKRIQWELALLKKESWCEGEAIRGVGKEWRPVL